MDGMNARMTSCIGAIGAWLAFAGPLLALDTHELPKLEASWGGISWLYFAVGLIGICAVAFKNSRRTHLQ